MDDTGLRLKNHEFPINRNYSENTSVPDLSLKWRNLSVWVQKKMPGPFCRKAKFENQRILNNVNGIAKSGTLMAITGASGAGKTTLIATLSQRMKIGVTEGEVLVNGRTIDKHLMKKISCFVPQHDLAIESLTVLEHMHFMARLTLDRHEPKLIRKRIVNNLLDELGLEKCKQTRLSSLSGGERKRVSLAAQLLTEPSILFCDEPTTGLDSFNANVVIEKLKMFAAKDKTVICTIHQPTSGIFAMFTKLLLLANGRVAYQGDVQGASHHFESVGLICSPNYNKAEFYVTNLAVVPGKEEESLKKINKLCDSFECSKYNLMLNEELSEDEGSRQFTVTSKNATGNVSFERHHSKKNTSLRVRAHTELGCLVWRDSINIVRNYPQYLFKLGIIMINSLIISSSYKDIALNQRGIQNIEGLFFIMISETFFSYFYMVLSLFPPELPIFLRDIGNDIYRPATFYISKMVTMLPQCFIGGFLFTTIIYNFNDLRGGYFALSIPVVMNSLTASAHGTALSAIFESYSMIALVQNILEFVIVMSCGLYIKINDIPIYFRWWTYVSQFSYGIEAVSVEQWDKVTSIECPADKSFPCLSTGDEVLSHMGYNINNYYVDIFALFMLYCVMHFIGFIGIWLRSKKQPVY